MFDADTVARELRIAKFDRSIPLADELSLPSSVLVRDVNPGVERVIVRRREGDDSPNSSRRPASMHGADALWVYAPPVGSSGLRD